MTALIQALHRVPLVRRPTPPARRRVVPPAAAGRRLAKGHCACGGSCPSCATAGIARRHDPLEREADRAADRVMRRPDPPAAAAGRTPAAASAGPAGRPLDGATRAFMESRLGHDFAAVRIHADAAAARSAEALAARAYTLGNDVVFAGDAYQPATDAGRRLLAHELGHVIQQRRGATTAIQRMADDGDFAPADFADTQPASADCDPTDDEGFPLLLRGAQRNAVGFAQTLLNRHLAQIVDCLRGTCNIPDINRQFIENELLKLTEFPLVVDCKFGPNTQSAVKIVQAFFLKDSGQWDGKIGPTTWGLLALVATPPAAEPPNIFLPNPPVPAPPGPILL